MYFLYLIYAQMYHFLAKQTNIFPKKILYIKI